MLRRFSQSKCSDGQVVQEVSLVNEDRDELAHKLESVDAVFHEQHQRFSEVLVLLSKTLAIPDAMLLRLSEPDVQEFELGLDQVRRVESFMLMCRPAHSTTCFHEQCSNIFQGCDAL